ncbi:hypothetical protein EDD86DRAFT_147899 [Gorgonomyces haynaldii]|nr:hypothetical protein EDD86DRAFT_147899 [Gorgonomyces haynaldii]
MTIERRVESHEVIYQVLDSLRSRIGEQTDNRFLLNKTEKQTAVQAPQSSVAISFDGPPGIPRKFKNVALNSSTNAQDIIQMGIKDFDIKDPNLMLVACIARTETELALDDLIMPLAAKAQSQIQRLTLMIRPVKQTKNASMDSMDVQNLIAPYPIVVANPEPTVRESGMFSPQETGKRSAEQQQSAPVSPSDAKIPPRSSAPRQSSVEQQSPGRSSVGQPSLRPSVEQKNAPRISTEQSMKQSVEQPSMKQSAEQSFGRPSVEQQSMKPSVEQAFGRPSTQNQIDVTSLIPPSVVSSKPAVIPPRTRRPSDLVSQTYSPDVKQAADIKATQPIPAQSRTPNVDRPRLGERPSQFKSPPREQAPKSITRTDKQSSAMSFDDMLDSIDTALKSGIKNPSPVISMQQLFDNLEKDIDRDLEELGKALQSTLNDTLKRSSYRRRSSFMPRSQIPAQAEIVKEDELDFLYDRLQNSTFLLDSLDKVHCFSLESG